MHLPLSTENQASEKRCTKQSENADENDQWSGWAHHRALRMKGRIQQHIWPANHLLVGWLHGVQNEESGENWGWGEHLFQLFRSSSLTTPTCLGSPDPGCALAPIDGASSSWHRRGADELLCFEKNDARSSRRTLLKMLKWLGAKEHKTPGEESKAAVQVSCKNRSVTNPRSLTHRFSKDEAQY